MANPVQSPSSQSLMQREERFGARNYHPLPVVLARGEGVWLFDVEGRRYLDMMSAYSAVSQGHLHPAVVRAAREQLERVGVVSRAFHTDQLGPFLEELCMIAGMERALPMNTGAEAVETAIKAVRRYAYEARGVTKDKAEIIVADGNFHGRTTTIVGFSSEAEYRSGFGPFAPGFVSVPFGDAHALEAAITPRTAAVLIEPIQGEAGIRVPPPGYLAKLRSICDRHGVLLVFDEIQTGLGRTGRMFCFEHEGARPDGLILGKSLGGGLVPVSAFLARADVMAVFRPGSHGSTFGGNPFAAAVGRAALRVIVEEDLPGRSARLGARLIEGLHAIDHPAVREVRGRGLFVGVDLEPALISARSVCEAMARHGVLSKETHDTVVHFAPPLVIGEAEIDLAVDVFAAALAEAGLTRTAA